MIESIHIKDVATFGSTTESLTNLAEINFLFGANGTGKSTISRVIADASKFPTCSTVWRGGTKMETLVYNRDFVDRNFGQSTELKGIFTLGERNKAILDQIKVAKDELDALVTKIEQYRRTLQGEDGNGGKKGDLAALEATFEGQCWDVKLKHDPKLQGAFEGVRGAKRNFKNRILIESKQNVALLKPLTELETKAASLFGESLEPIAVIPVPNSDKLLALESNTILRKKVIGKSDVDIAAMIQKLGNSDWVKQGKAFYEINDKVCPFCQQQTPDSLMKSLNEYFDEMYLHDTEAIDQLVTDYRTESERLQQSIETILSAACKFLDVEKLKAEKALLDTKIRNNLLLIERKRKESSQSVELESLKNVLETATGILETANKGIGDHNTMVSNLANERRELAAQVWRYLLDVEIKTQLASFKSTKDGLDKAIASLNEQITDTDTEKRKKETEIRKLEKNTTSIQPTIDGINALLTAFGFIGFRLAKSDKERFYKIVRADGSDAKDTLSEGEANFITFLYFYHLLKGSETETDMTTDRIVVFDDPVSSLDSDVLFIVSSLIKGVFEEVRADTGQIKQVFVLTHNVYFHKEVSFNSRRPSNGVLKDETFWMIKKPGPNSMVERHTSNPIKTSYELLWLEVRRPDRSSLAIQNILRRILENYFKILGNTDFDSICDKFEGKEKLICKSLVSWVHEGSHSIHDDLYVSIDGNMVDNYLAVFKKIFEKLGHLSHYEMMMADATPTPQPKPATLAVTATVTA